MEEKITITVEQGNKRISHMLTRTALLSYAGGNLLSEVYQQLREKLNKFICSEPEPLFLYRNKKTGEVYTLLNAGYVIDATNGRENEERMALYTKVGVLFVRKWSEFEERFEKVK